MQILTALSNFENKQKFVTKYGMIQPQYKEDNYAI